MSSRSGRAFEIGVIKVVSRGIFWHPSHSARGRIDPPARVIKSRVRFQKNKKPKIREIRLIKGNSTLAVYCLKKENRREKEKNSLERRLKRPDDGEIYGKGIGGDHLVVVVVRYSFAFNNARLLLY